MEKELQERLMENYDEKNIENVRAQIGTLRPTTFRMFVNESGNGSRVKITKESREICVQSLLEYFFSS